MNLKVLPLFLTFGMFDIPKNCTSHYSLSYTTSVCAALCLCVCTACALIHKGQPCTGQHYFSETCTVQYAVGLSLKGFPLAHCRGGSFQSMGGWRRGEGQRVREVGLGRGSRFQRPTDLTLNHGAWSSEWHRILTVQASVLRHRCQKHVCYALLHVDVLHRQTHVGWCTHMLWCLLVGVCFLSYFCVISVCVFSRCNAAGRIYMTSKTGSCYQ